MGALSANTDVCGNTPHPVSRYRATQTSPRKRGEVKKEHFFSAIRRKRGEVKKEHFLFGHPAPAHISFTIPH